MLTSILSIDDVSIAEGDDGASEVMVTVTRTGAVAGDLNSEANVSFNTLDGTATTADSDYVAKSDGISFSAEATALTQTQTFTIQVNSDLTTEEDETFDILLSGNSANTMLGDDTATITILNDDQTALTIDDITVNESDLMASVLVSLDHPLDTAVSFDFSVFDETANNTTDYSSLFGTRTFDPGDQSIVIEIPLVDSDQVESTETFLVLLSNIQTTSSSLIVSDTLAKVRILDDDQASLTIDDVFIDEDLGAGMVTVFLDKPVDRAISIDYTTADQTALSSDSDYSPASGTLTFEKNVQSLTIPVTLGVDNIVELDETFLINLMNLQANDADVIIGDDQAAVTIQNDDHALISIGDITVQEDMGPAILTVTLDQSIDTDISFDVNTVDNTALSSTDYDYIPDTLVISAGMTSIEIPITIIDSELVELDESFLVNLANIQANGRSVSFANTQATVTIQDDQQANMTIDDITVTEDEAGGMAILTVSLDRPVDTDVSVVYTTNNGSALNGTDYSLMSDTLTFTAGQQSKTIMIPLVDDNLIEGDESFVVDLDSLEANGAMVVITKTQGEVMIEDDDAATISILEDVEILEDVGMASVTLKLDQVVETDVTVSFTTQDQTALNTFDFTAIPDSVTFNAGEDTATIMIPIINDDLVEDSESFLVDLTNIDANGANITFTDTQAEITILDNDASIISINSVPTNEDAGTITVTVSLNNPVDREISVDYFLSNSSATDPDDYSGLSGTLMFGAGELSKTIDVPINIEDLVEDDETFFMNLENLVTNGADLTLGETQDTVTILNDDQGVFSISDVTVVETDGAMAILTVALDKPVDRSIVIEYTTQNQTTGSPDDYTPTTDTLTFAPGPAGQSQQIMIPIINDNLLESDETFLVNLTIMEDNGADVTLGVDQAVVTIEDDEQAMISIDDVLVNENDGTATLTVTLDKAATSAFTLDFTTNDYAPIDQSALEGSDYTLNSGSLAFAIGETSKTISVTLINDLDVVEGDEIFLVNLSNIQANGANITFADAEAEVTIEDNEATTISINDISVDEGDASGMATITVTLDQPVETAVSVLYTTNDQTALAGSDYTVESGTLSFAAGVDTATIMVPISNDTLVEGPETFLVDLISIEANGANVTFADNQGEVTIIDNDASTIDIGDLTVNENEISGIAELTVTLTQAVDNDISINYETVDQSASDPGDYTPPVGGGTITILAGEMSGTIEIPLVDDMLVEAYETFLVNLTGFNANGADVSMGNNSATVTIHDDDTATISIDDISVDENDPSGMALLTVSLSQVVETTVTVDYITADGTAFDVLDYGMSFDTLTFASGEDTKTIMVPIVDNMIVEGDETFLVNLSITQTNGANITFEDDGQAEVTIVDDESASFSIDDIVRDESAGTVILTVSLNLVVQTDISIDFTTISLTAGSPDDYTMNSGTLLFESGDLMQEITIDIIDDNLVEDDESLLVSLSNIQDGTNVTIAKGQGFILIEDNDEASLTIQDMTVNEMEGTVSVDVTLDNPIDTTISVDYFTTPGSALDPDDFTSQSGTLTFNPNDQLKTITIPLTNDIDIVEGDETFLINLINLVPNGAAVTIGDDQATVTIIDDETATISIDDITIDENAPSGMAVLTVSLSQPVATTVTVDYTTVDNTALDPDDYTAKTDTLTFAPGVETQTIMLPIIDDLDIVEGDESFFVDLSNILANGANITFDDSQGEVTIIDDETATISIDDITIDENDPSGMAVLTVSLSQPVATTVTVDYTTVDNTALDPDDYTAKTDTLAFAPGVETQTIMVPIIDDLDIVEGDESFFVDLSNILANGANITFDDSQGEVTIIDDETATISIDDITIDENDPSGMAVLTVSLSQPVATTVTVDYTTVDNTALDPDDYTAKTDTLAFAPGVETQTIMLPIIDDLDIVEGDESFFVDLSNILANGANITFDDSQGEVTIIDDETATISIDDITIDENAPSGMAVLTVSLSQPVATTVTVDYTTVDNTALDPDDYTAKTDTLAFAPGVETQTIMLPIIDDLDIVEGDESFFVDLSNILANGANITFDDSQGEVTIIDDETATISIDDITIDENDPSGMAVLTVSLSQPVATTVTVDYTTVDNTALDPDDYTAKTDTLAFAPGVETQTIMIPIIDDSLIEGNESFFVNLSNIFANGANITFADNQGEVTILDDDQGSFSINDMTVNEDAMTATLTVTLDQPVEISVSVDYTTADNSALEPDDYTSRSGTLTFDPGQQSKTITIPIVESNEVEGVETFFVNLSNIQSGTAGLNFADSQGVITILDNDHANLIISDLTIDETSGTAEVTVSLENPVYTTISVDYRTHDQTAVNSVDYLYQSGSLTFNPGEMTKTISLTILDNPIVEFTETLLVSLSNLQTISAANVTLTDNQATITIIDDDYSTVSINDISVDEDAGTATLTVMFEFPVHSTVTIDYFTSDDSATAPTDYLSQSGTLIIDDGEQLAFITIPIIDSNAVELTETLLVNLSNLQADGLDVTFADAQAEITIFDYDQASLTINDIVVNESTGTADITVSLNQPVETIVTVDYATVDQTALDVNDFLAASGTLTFNPGEQFQTITVPLVDTDLVEADETFLINLTNLQTNGSDVALTDDQATITIIDDDLALISIDDTSVNEDAGTVSITVSLDHPVDTTVSVDFSTSDQTALDLVDYLANSGTITFDPEELSKTITIDIIDSIPLERDESFLVNLFNLQSNGLNVAIEDNQAQVTIIDDVSASAEINMRVVNTPTYTDPNGEATSLPEHQAWVSEWASYWVEIWVNANSPTGQGVYTAAFDLEYATEYTSATTIEFGTAFTQNQSGIINDLAGTISGLSAETDTSGLGINNQLLFARIKFESLTVDQVALDIPGKSIGPYDLGLEINSQQITLESDIPVTTNLGAFDGTSIYANPFDLDDNDSVNSRDLIALINAYQSVPSESSSDIAWFVDYDQNDYVNHRDLSLFVNNYGKSKLNQSPVTYPANFPDVWNSLLIADAQTESSSITQPISQSDAETAFESVLDHVSDGLSSSESQTLEHIDIQVVDLKGDTLGRAAAGTIYIDVNAAGHGWFVDTTPADHSEFAWSSELTLIALPDSEAADRIDLRTVILHELSHILGYEHENEGIMQDSLAPGVRKLSTWELNFEFDNQSTPEETDSFFLTVQDGIELLPF
ncbi:Calx-beta domain-containing protein [Gimesia fumaroli]|nr:Calx-beta domain-containing protein [Gimesia fumaroli]